MAICYICIMYTHKKSLGQHFLRDENICRKIIAAVQERSFSQLLEVGPGAGALTKYILQLKGVDFKAVELDDEKVQYLLTTYPALYGKIIHQSFLEIEKPFSGSFTIIGNFPYNISSQILFKILDWKDEVECVIGMFQKEVGRRIASREGNKVYGVTSVLVQAFFDVEYLFEVNEQSFTPPPKIKSSVIRLVRRKESIEMKDEKFFVQVVKTAFNQRRKTLRNALKGVFDATMLEDKLFNKRAEELSVQEFADLTFRKI